MIRGAEYLLIFLLSLLVSCEKDEKLIIGKWNMVSSTLVNYYKNEVVSDTIYNYESGKNVLELLADGTAKIYRYNDLVGTYNWEISRKWLIINYYTEVYIGAGSGRFEYTINNTTLNLRSEGVTKHHNNNYRFVMVDSYSRN
jgi:hypothetical protein